MARKRGEIRISSPKEKGGERESLSSILLCLPRFSEGEKKKEGNAPRGGKKKGGGGGALFLLYRKENRRPPNPGEKKEGKKEKKKERFFLYIPSYARRKGKKNKAG